MKTPGIGNFFQLHYFKKQISFSNSACFLPQKCIFLVKFVNEKEKFYDSENTPDLSWNFRKKSIKPKFLSKNVDQGTYSY
jgi:hypothetical protein